MAFTDNAGREALIQLLTAATADAGAADLEVTGTPNGDVLVMEHRGLSTDPGGGPTLHTLALTFVAENPRVLEAIAAKVKYLRPNH
jgi:hypothetical protein